jgi:hypothetical protein
MQPAGKLPCAECAADFSFEGGREKERVRELGSSRMFVEETSREWSLTAAAPFDKNSKKTEDNPPLKKHSFNASQGYQIGYSEN